MRLNTEVRERISHSPVWDDDDDPEMIAQAEADASIVPGVVEVLQPFAYGTKASTPGLLGKMEIAHEDGQDVFRQKRGAGVLNKAGTRITYKSQQTFPVSAEDVEDGLTGQTLRTVAMSLTIETPEGMAARRNKTEKGWLTKFITALGELSPKEIEDFKAGTTDSCYYFLSADRKKALCQRDELVIRDRTEGSGKEHRRYVCFSELSEKLQEAVTTKHKRALKRLEVAVPVSEQVAKLDAHIAEWDGFIANATNAETKANLIAYQDSLKAKRERLLKPPKPPKPPKAG